MFSESLLDSSPQRLPILRGGHWRISALAGLAAFAGTVLAVSYLGLLHDPQSLFMVAAVPAAAVFGTSLMLCYVYADARHWGLSAASWLCVVGLLNLPGFVIYLIYSASRSGNWKRAAVPLAYLSEGMLVGVAVLLPLIYTQALPKTLLFVRDLPAPPPAPPPPAALRAASRPVVRHWTADDLLKAPVTIPKNLVRVVEEPLPPEDGVGSSWGVPGGIRDGVPGGMPPGIPDSLAWKTVPPPPPQPRAARPTLVRVGGQVQPPKLIYQPRPEYPPLAKVARIQGTVRLEAIIGRDGTIQNLKVLEGHPLLVKAAVEAVERWRYQPTLLNGEPVDVLTEIDVNFNLNE